jgi:vitamin B12 transporter
MLKMSLTAALIAGQLWAGSLHAQSQNPPETVDQIIVTAARTPVLVEQVGNATTVISRAEIDRRQARYVTDLLRAVPGFSVAHSGVAGSQTQVRVRGAEANHVLVLIDGVRANDPATGDEFRWEFLSTGSIERIEIVRGPQSSLWGSDAVAAVVHVITRSNSGNPYASAYAEGGSNTTGNVGFNAGTASGSWRIGAGIEHLNTEGQNISRSGNETDGSDLTTASLTARYDASQSLQFDVAARFVDAYSQFDPVDFVTTGLPTDADVATDTSQVFIQAGTRLSTLGGKITHGLRAHYFDTSNHNSIDGVRESSTASDRLRFAYQADIEVGESRLAVALEHEQTTFEQRGTSIFGDPNQDQRIDVTSIIADMQGLAFGRLSWLASARFDDNSDFDDALTGRLSLSYPLGDATTVRASVGSGQKNPTFTERFGFFPGQFVGNPGLKPERATSYEMGIDQRLLDNRLFLQLSLFRSDLRDEINGFVFDPVTFLSTAENRESDSNRSGVEMAANWNVTEQVTVAAAYTYTDSSAEDASGATVRELRRPRHTGSISTAYQFAAERAEISVTADYSGESNDQYFPPFPDPSEIITLDDFWTVDLNVNFRVSPRTSLFVRATNLLDEDYEQVYGYRTLGRSLFAGVRFGFGQ